MPWWAALLVLVLPLPSWALDLTALDQQGVGLVDDPEVVRLLLQGLESAAAEQEHGALTLGVRQPSSHYQRWRSLVRVGKTLLVVDELTLALCAGAGVDVGP